MTEPTPIAVYRDETGECQYCDDGADLGSAPHSHEIYAQREGANTRTNDELSLIFSEDVADIVPNYTMPRATERPMLGTDDWDAWQELADVAETALADAGFSVVWNDGYVIERVTVDADPS